jgi:hypothetical protein
MPIETRWLVSASASCWHAVEAIARGSHLVDSATHGALYDKVAELLADIQSLGLDREQFFQYAVPMAVQFDVPGEWAKALLAKLVGPAPAPDAVQQLARQSRSIETAFLQANPHVLGDLELRIAPLMGQWEARGPGLMTTAARLTEPELIVEQAEVIAVHPVLGGGGAAHWLNNSVRIEAVLANPLPELPEVLRLGWLLAQLHLDLPRFHGTLHRDRRTEIWQLAMIPPLLTAGEQVELTRFGQSTVAAATAAWTGNRDARTPGALFAWWDTYAATNPSWPAALAALDRLLIAE